MPKRHSSIFRFFAKRTPDERASHDLMRMRTVSDLKKCLGLGRETTEALIALERDGDSDLNPDINLNINKEPHNKAKCLFSFDALIGTEAAGMDYDDLRYRRTMRFKDGFPMFLMFPPWPRHHGGLASTRLWEAALDRFEGPTDVATASSTPQFDPLSSAMVAFLSESPRL